MLKKVLIDLTGKSGSDLANNLTRTSLLLLLLFGFAFLVGCHNCNDFYFDNKSQQFISSHHPFHLIRIEDMEELKYFWTITNRDNKRIYSFSPVDINTSLFEIKYGLYEESVSRIDFKNNHHYRIINRFTKHYGGGMPSCKIIFYIDENGTIICE